MTTTPAEARVSLRRILPFAAAATYLWMVAVLAIWVIGPTIGFGWTPILVDAGSMEPTVSAGDIVLVAQNNEETYLRGEVITYADPVWEGELVTHRIVATLPDDHYRTRGDASAVNDSTPIPHADVLGSGRLLIPKIGLPVVWLAQAPVLLALWVLLTITAWVLVVRIRTFGPDAQSASPTNRVRRPSSRFDQVIRPRPVAGSVRRWAPLVVATVAAVPLVTPLGPAALLWPFAIGALDPRGPEVRIGWLADRWRGGQVTRFLPAVPTTSTIIVVLTVAMTLTSTAMFTAASPNPTNSFALDVIDPATDLTATQTCSGGNPTITLDWTPSPNPRATGYEIVRNGTPLMTVVPGSSTTFADATPDDQTAYVYEVNAYATAWNSPVAAVSITTNCYTGPPTSGIIPSDASGEYAMTVPAAVQPGDFMLVYINADSDKFTEAAGWTEEASKNDGGKNSHVRLYSRVATVGDPGSTYVFSSDDGGVGIATLIVYTGVDTSNPVEKANIQSYGPTTSPEATQVKPKSPDSLAVVFWEFNIPATLTPPGNLTTRISGSDNGRTMLVADGVFSTDTGNFIASSDIAGEGASISVLLNPAPGSFAALRLTGPNAVLDQIAGIDASTMTHTGGSNGRLDTTQLIDIGHGHSLQPAAAAAYANLRDAAHRDLGIDLSAHITDSYRTFEQQVSLAALKGLYSQGGLAAEPGTSNHGLGMALDISTAGGLGNWLALNAPGFGFHTIPREPWHWEYRGLPR